MSDLGKSFKTKVVVQDEKHKIAVKIGIPVILIFGAVSFILGVILSCFHSCQHHENPETLPAVVSQETTESSVLQMSQNSVKSDSVPVSSPASDESSETHESPESSVQPIQETSVEPVISSQPVVSSQPVSSQPSNPAFKGDVVSETNKTGNCGGNISYKLENGTLTLTGTGSMYDDFEEFQNDDSIKTVIVNAGIIGISAYAFSGCSALESVDIVNELEKRKK